MAPEDKIRKKKPWWKRAAMALIANFRICIGYDKDIKENVKLTAKTGLRF